MEKILILDKFVYENQNCLLTVEVGTKTNFNMLNLGLMSICPALDGKCHFLTDLTQKYKLSVSDETWGADLFRHAESSSDLHLICLEPEIPFFGQFNPKNKKTFVKNET